LSLAQESDPTVVVDPDRLSAMHYRSIGPYCGGRSTAGTSVPSKPFTFYMGANGGGVWETTDAGETWTHVGLKDVGQIPEIAIHPENLDSTTVDTCEFQVDGKR